MRKRYLVVLLLIFLLLITIFVLDYSNITGFFIKEENTDYECPDCNIILISIDTLRADHLGVYGYEKNTSPNIDRFAENAIVFENSFSQSSWTLPSHMSIMTSLYPSMHGVVSKDKKLPDSATTIAEVLKENEYTTAAFTAGHLVSKKYGFDQGFDIYKEKYDKHDENSGQGYRLKYLEKDLFSWLDNCSKDKFFLFIHTYDTHEPFIVHSYLKEFEKNYAGKFNMLNNHSALVNSINYDNYLTLANRSSMNINNFYGKIINKKRVNWSKDDEEHIIALYDNEIRFMDYYLGRIIDKLKRLNLLNNTVIILTSDHGEELFERGKVQHGGVVYDELISVPLIIRLPDNKITYSRNKELAQGIDIAPTILDMLNIEPEDSFKGISLLSLENHNSFIISQVISRGALRTKKVKLIYNGKKNSSELYDLENDPDELNNIAESEPSAVEMLKKILFDALDNPNFQPEQVEMDKETLEQLKALGYMI